MRYVASYLLAILGGNTTPTSADLEKALGSVGIECDINRIEKVIAQLDGKPIEKMITAGRQKLCSTRIATRFFATLSRPRPVVVEVKKGIKVEQREESEESDDVMGFGLFD